MCKLKQTQNKEEKSKVLIFFIGITLFISSFFTTGWLAAVFFFNTYEIEFIGLISVSIFVGVLAYLITKYRAFNIKLAGAQVLVFTLWILVGSLILVAKSNTTQIVSGFTLIFTTIAGYLLIKSVQKEIKQREEIEKLAQGLEKANNRLRELDKQKSEFVSIASHQLRSPLTAIRGYSSLLSDGSYGEVTEKQKEILQHIQDSGKLMASSIEDYLSISRIESGNMKYEYSDFNLKEMCEHLVDELRTEAMQAGLLLQFKSNMNTQGIIHADKGKTYQIIHNLVNNAIKYTPQGTVTVQIEDNQATKKILVNIIDTGIGMNQATMAKLFEKFSRADNANAVNIKGTGLGLYVARALARAMKGDVTVSSEGDGKGSTFTFSIPYQM